MKTFMPNRLFWLLPVLAAVLSASASADTITFQNKATMTRPIVRLTAAGILVDKNQMAAWASVASVLFDRAPLQAPGQLLLLRNGIGLCGIVAHTTRDALTFQSITAGEITVAWSNVTAIRYGPSPSSRIILIRRPAKSSWFQRTTKGRRVPWWAPPIINYFSALPTA